MNRNFLVLGDDSQPIGMLDAHLIGQDGTLLAVALAAAAADPDQCAELVVEMQDLMDQVAYQCVLTAALVTLATEILEPTLKVADRAGVPLRPIVRAISAALLPDQHTSTTDPEGPK